MQFPATSSLIASANGSSKFSKQKSRERKKEIIAPSSPQQQQQRRRQAAPILFDILPLEELTCRRFQLFLPTNKSSITLPTKEKRKLMKRQTISTTRLQKNQTRNHGATRKHLSAHLETRLPRLLRRTRKQIPLPTPPPAPKNSVWACVFLCPARLCAEPIHNQTLWQNNVTLQDLEHLQRCSVRNSG